MKTPSVSTLKKSFRAGTSSLKKTTQSIFHIPSPPRFVVFGVLGTAGPLERINVGFMMTDYVVWLAFFWEMAGLDTSRSQCHSIRPIVQHFPEDKVVLGEAACERLRIPLPPCLDKFDHTLLTESKFCDEIRTQLQHTGETMKPGETLVLLLIGHGGASTEDDFLFYVTTRYGRSGAACITKRQLELAVVHCKAEVIIICNSCKSGALQSPLWTLLCAARPTEYAEAITPSQSGYARVSAFNLCAFAQAGKEQGLLIPPRSEPRPQGISIHGMAKATCFPANSLVPLNISLDLSATLALKKSSFVVSES
ncbi:hypothetical protein BT96DRAFT_668223 [Gymnopus androsaceus JB14]|uniref:Caspase family p20 domain-containing protein n=1 Tax=Gymnopus androsaceus JB14 TaxID=1447944 RepID=A0A6A4I9C1_9AGAR|nr:hypothetical protein BT96DRAFT_668223 [Gymnopus androsaceus JB14]